jgi:hypothetical protein
LEGARWCSIAKCSPARGIDSDPDNVKPSLGRKANVVGVNRHPHSIIKSVRGEALHAGVQRKLVALLKPRSRHQPFKQPGSMPLGPLRFVRHQIVDVEGFSGK